MEIVLRPKCYGLKQALNASYDQINGYVKEQSENLCCMLRQEV